MTSQRTKTWQGEEGIADLARVHAILKKRKIKPATIAKELRVRTNDINVVLRGDYPNKGDGRLPGYLEKWLLAHRIITWLGNFYDDLPDPDADAIEVP